MTSPRPLLSPSPRTPTSTEIPVQSWSFNFNSPLPNTGLLNFGIPGEAAPSFNFNSRMERKGSKREGPIKEVNLGPGEPGSIRPSLSHSGSKRQGRYSDVSDNLLQGYNSRPSSVSAFEISRQSSDRLSQKTEKEQGFPKRYGSRGTDSDALGASQREISDENSRLIFINDPDQTNDKYEFAGNQIRTSKYTVFTFLPRNLFEQFHRVAYIYFLLLIILNQLPWLQVFGRASSFLPLAFVLLVTAIKDVYEDWRRHRSDRTENNRKAEILQDGSFQPKEWKKIRVGEVVKISANETLPCDIVLLGSSDSSGVAYIQTINLDGESNLKTRYAKQETLLRMPEREPISGTIRCEEPNRNIYGFYGYMEFEGKRISLGPSNIILRGCELKNTAWVIGVAVYAGQETKVMLNNSGAPSKRSRLESHMNRETIYLSLFLMVICAVVGLGMGLWLGRHKEQLSTLPYFRDRYFKVSVNKVYNYYGIGAEVVIAILSAVIIFQIMIPISLYISMELVRLGQAYFMIRDKKMYDSVSKSKFQCRALNINEDLGQIKYVFSDKTGTLTENKMEFRDASVFGRNYSTSKTLTEFNYQKSSLENEEKEIFAGVNVGETWKAKMEVRVEPRLVQLLQKDNVTLETRFAHDYFLALAACNTVVPIITETSEGVKLVEYQGESPDEQALAYAAAAYGYTLIERTSGYIVIDVHGKRKRLDVLGLHEFDSDRKRMSVIVQCPDNTLKLLVKGADSSMLGIIDKSLNIDLSTDNEGSSTDLISSTESHLHEYSLQGLRTLVIGARDLSVEEYEDWHHRYEEANSALTGRARKLRATAARIECRLNLLGATGIEDKLQQGVPETIEKLRQAGIKVWVLTGDKQETAISIGVSCKLLTESMQQIIINGKSKQACQKLLADAKAMYGITKAERKKSSLQRHKDIDNATVDNIQSSNMSGTKFSESMPQVVGKRMHMPLALIIDGTSLVYILESTLEEELFDLATKCTVVLCCRVAPMQKAGIVALIKNRTYDMTLAIGDGANDVSMIQMADVGVGISGQEGRQAVMASDFAMGQFRFLERLLLVHGHWNYNRMGYMILYNFYRNAVYVMMLFW